LSFRKSTNSSNCVSGTSPCISCELPSLTRSRLSRSLLEGRASCFHDALCRHSGGVRRERSLYRRCFGVSHSDIFEAARTNVRYRANAFVRESGSPWSVCSLCCTDRKRDAVPSLGCLVTVSLIVFIFGNFGNLPQRTGDHR
jgi:hypothetical protein